MSGTGAFFSDYAARAFAGRRVLLTGATGFVGRHLAGQALAAGVELHVLTRSTALPGAVAHHADLTDAAGVRAAMRSARPHVLIHAAAPGVGFGSMPLGQMLAVTAGGTEALYAAAAELPQPPQVIHLGSGFEYTPADHPVDEGASIVPSGGLYGAAKAAGAAVAGAYAGRLTMTLLRPFHIYGPGEASRRLGPSVIAETLAGRPVELTGGEQVRDFLHVDDCARAIWLAADSGQGFRVLNLGSGERRPLRDYIAAIGRALAAAGHEPDLRFGAVPYRPGEPMVSVPDLSRLRATLDWRAAVPLEDGTADYVAWSLAQCA